MSLVTQADPGTRGNLLRFLAFMFALVVSIAVAIAIVTRAAIVGHERSGRAQNPAAAATPASPNVAQAVANVQSFYNRVNTFESDFEQQYTLEAYNHTTTSDGHVTFSRPGRMNWVYKNPPGDRVVSNGQTIQVLQPSNHQTFQQPVSASPYPAALSFLTSQGTFSTSFTFTVWPGSQVQMPSGYVLVGVPVQATSAYSKVLLYVDASTSQVGRVMIIDAQGNRNRFDFVNPKFNGAVNASTYSFTP
jgi:outer membrane lipoprotein carrier protein